MSRHKILKNMDLDDELDDFDGGEDYDDDGGYNGSYCLPMGLCMSVYEETLTGWLIWNHRRRYRCLLLSNPTLRCARTNIPTQNNYD